MAESKNKSVKEAVDDVAQMLHDLLLIMNREHTCKLCEKYS